MRLSCCSFHYKYTKHTLLFVFNSWKCSINVWFCFFALEKPRAPFFPSSKPLNILDDELFVVYFPLNTLFLLFCGILSCSCISCAYPVAVYNVNTQGTPYCLFLTAENVVLRSWKHQLYLCSYFQSSKYVRRHLVCCFSGCKYVISAVLRHFNS